MTAAPKLKRYLPTAVHPFMGALVLALVWQGQNIVEPPSPGTSDKLGFLFNEGTSMHAQLSKQKGGSNHDSSVV